ncbi:DUF4905 domain-containing protein [Pedobacter sp. HMF7647]|uniref:DUF4905 domain-containing protein n=1 Tax=Hufsiella arboris TaxID=2695275 RepID=A0A7K1Y7Y2_9SPHI|nr:DUF4905 domain-containing protein [Hufsiella arboris]MXV50692.1 DUF4905 domain-containing protein [Hufsiella arboris]
MQNMPGYSFSHRFSGTIWKIELDKIAGYLAIETRTSGQKYPDFSLFDYITGTCLFDQINFPEYEQWTLDKADSGHVLLHGYLREGSPERNGIIVLTSKGQIAWQKFNYALEAVANGVAGIYNANVQPRRIEYVAVSNGGNTSQPDLSFDYFEDFRFPTMTNQPVPGFEEIAGSLSHLQINGKSIYSFHRKAAGGYEQFLSLYQGDQLIFEEKIDGPIQKLNPEAFFIHQNNLFFIRNKNEIVSYLV